MTTHGSLTCEDAIRFSEIAPSIGCVLSPDGRIVYANSATYKILGYSPGELAETSVADLVHPHDRQEFDRAFAGLLGAPEQREHATRFRTVKGDYRWLLWTVAR